MVNFALKQLKIIRMNSEVSEVSKIGKLNQNVFKFNRQPSLNS